MDTVVNRWQYLSATFYACIASTFLGAILLDIIYANASSNNPGSPDMRAVFSQAADFLLLLAAITFFAGLGAIATAWHLSLARNLFIASLFFVTAELLTPILFGSLLTKAQANLGLPIGTWIRLAGSALSAILALVALWDLHPSNS
jgi:hypothetical protein